MALAGGIRLLADAAGTIDITNRAEVRGRSTQNIAPNPAIDLVDTATARAGLTGRLWDFTLGYSAMVMDADAELGTLPSLIQSGDIGATWHEGNVTISVAEYGAYGVQNPATTGALPQPTTGVAPPAPSVQLLAQPGDIRFGASRTALTATDRLGRRETLSLGLEYAAQGGLDPASQAALPLVRGARANAALIERLSPRDAVDLRLELRRSDTASGPCSLLIQPALLPQPTQACDPVGIIEQITGTWRYDVSASTQVSAGAGVAFVQLKFQDEQSGFDSAALPVATAGLQRLQVVGHLSSTVRLDLSAAPFIDLRTGVVDERAQLTGSLRLPTHAIVYSGTLGATRSITSTFMKPVTSVQAGLEAEYLASPEVGLGAGFRYIWQEDVLGELSVATAIVELTWRAPRIRF